MAKPTLRKSRRRSEQKSRSWSSDFSNSEFTRIPEEFLVTELAKYDDAVTMEKLSAILASDDLQVKWFFHWRIELQYKQLIKTNRRTPATERKSRVVH